MVQEQSSHTSHSAKSTKRIFSRLIKSSKQAAIDNELADLEEAIQRSSLVLLPAVLTPSRAPSNTLIASTRALFFEGPIHLDFASGWAKGPVIEWYERHRSKGSILIEKLQLRRDLQPPYYHEYIVVFTQSGRTFRVDRRPDPDAPFDTIMRAGCKPYDTIQAVESRSLRELEKVSDCVVEVHWHGKPTIDLLFILSICFALRQDEYAKQYTLQRYNCYFLSWTIIMATVREMAAWETRLSGAMSRAFLDLEQKANYRVAQAPSLADHPWTPERYLEDHLGHYVKFVFALARVCVLRRRTQVHVDPSLNLDLVLARVQALEPTLKPAQVQDARELRRLSLELEREREWVGERERQLRVRTLEARPWELPWERPPARTLELGLERELEKGLARRRKLELDLDHVKGLVRERELEQGLAKLGPRALGLAQELVPQLVTLMVEHSADAMSKLLFPAALDVWGLTMLQNTQSSPLSKRYVR